MDEKMKNEIEGYGKAFTDAVEVISKTYYFNRHGEVLSGMYEPIPEIMVEYKVDEEFAEELLLEAQDLYTTRLEKEEADG